MGPYDEAMASATLDLVTHDDAQPASPAVHLEDHTTLSYGELAGLVGESERALRHDGKALVLCAGDRDLPTLLAYLAALRLGHAVAFLPASDEILSAYQPEYRRSGARPGTGLADLGYRPAAELIAGTTIFQRKTQPAGEIYIDMALLLGTSGSTGSPKTVRLSFSGLAGNTAAVIRALGITAAERAPTTLPITHVYGLSVLNSSPAGWRGRRARRPVAAVIGDVGSPGPLRMPRRSPRCRRPTRRSARRTSTCWAAARSAP